MAKKKRATKKKRLSVGRPTKFDPANCEQVTKLCKLGATDKDLADFYSVNEKTIINWKKDPAFLRPLNALIVAPYGSITLDRTARFFLAITAT